MKYSTVERQRTAGGSTPTYEVQNSRIASYKSRDTMQASRHGKKKNQGSYTMFDKACQRNAQMLKEKKGKSPSLKTARRNMKS